MCAYDDQTFWPSTTKRSPSSRAEARTPARSEPAPGSENPWHQISSAARSGLQVARLLLVGAARDDRRAGHPEPDHAEVGRRLGARFLLEVDRLEPRREPASAELLRPRDPDPAAVVERAAPRAHLRAVEAGRAAPVALQLLREVRVEPRRAPPPGTSPPPACRGSPRGDATTHSGLDQASHNDSATRVRGGGAVYHRATGAPPAGARRPSSEARSAHMSGPESEPIGAVPDAPPPAAGARARARHASSSRRRSSRSSASSPGQDEMLERVLVCLVAGGHLLIEGVPGLAKTLTIKTTAAVLGGSFKRIQFTPDLVPSDLVGHPRLPAGPRAASTPSSGRSSATSSSRTRSTAPPRRCSRRSSR